MDGNWSAGVCVSGAGNTGGHRGGHSTAFPAPLCVTLGGVPTFQKRSLVLMETQTEASDPKLRASSCSQCPAGYRTFQQRRISFEEIRACKRETQNSPDKLFARAASEAPRELWDQCPPKRRAQQIPLAGRSANPRRCSCHVVKLKIKDEGRAAVWVMEKWVCITKSHLHARAQPLLAGRSPSRQPGAGWSALNYRVNAVLLSGEVS